MTIKKSTVSQIQRAGQAIHDAAQSLSRDAHVAGEKLHQKMTADLHDPQADRLYEQWKSVAKMAQDLVQMEAGMLAVYESCTKIALQIDASINAVPAKKSGKTQVAQTRVTAVPLTPTQPKRKPGRPSKKATSKGDIGIPKEGNEQRLIEHFTKVLNHTDLMKVHHQEITAATGIPSGSIAATIKRLVSKNLLVAGRRGALRLTAAPNGNPSAAPENTGEAAAPAD